MRKITFLLALLCVSMMGWAVQYCNYPIHHFSEDSENSRILVSIGPTGNTNEYIITIKPNTEAGNTKQLDYLYATIGNGGTTTPFPIEAGTDEGGGHDQLSATFTYTGGSSDLMLQWSYPEWGGRNQYTFTNIDLSALESCSGGSSKPSSELSLNATSITLEKDVTAETFQIVPTKAEGSGAISYSSNATDVATVSETGLVTAVGNGTATITVSVAENASYAAESKTLTVEVIDWPNIGWLQNGENAYKLHISPAIGGTQRIEGSNLWVGFPDAVIGDISITPSGGEGAWRTFALSNFQGRRSQFTAVWQGNTYTFMVYRNFEGVNLAKGMPSTAGRDASNAWQSNDGNRGSRWASGGAAKHYATYGDLAEDWWVVDLGAFYEISSIKTLYEGATPKNYSFYTSPNNDSWIEIDSYNHTPKAGTGDGDYNEYLYSPSKVARYVKIFAREAVQADFGYGISIWEFEVYGQPAENVDVNAPELASAAVSGTPTTSEIKIAVSASDTEDGEISLYRVRESSLKMDRNFTAVDGKLTFGDLLEGTNYSFTITALDNIGNQSNAIVVNASTAADPTMPQVAAPTPDGTGKEVRPIYSDAFPSILAHPFDKDGWGGVPLMVEKNISGDNCLIYNVASANEVIWGMYDDGNSAIIAADGYHSADGKGVDASAMTHLHIDIWSLQVCTNAINININDAGLKTLRLSHDGTGWNSYDIALDEFAEGDAGKQKDNVRWFKFNGIGPISGKMALDNVYFWAPASGMKSVSATSNNATMGSAAVKVGEDDVTSVPEGTEVRFIATANPGYVFVNWTQGGVEVSTSLEYSTTITSNTALVANFEVARTAYCATPVTDVQESRTLYLTICRTENANEYKILFEGSANNKITGDNVYVGTTLTLANVNGESSYAFNQASGQWHVSSEGFGSAYITFTATNYRDISFVSKGVDLFRDNSAGGNNLSSFNAFPDASLIKWDATCTDEEAPVLAAPTATPLSGTSVRLAVSATDDMAALLTYNVNYKPEGDTGAGTDLEFNGTAGEVTYKNIKGLSAGVRYQFSVTVSDGTNTSAAQVCYAKPTMPTAPVPAHNANLVRSIYSDKYESALAHDFIKNNWNWIPYTPQSIGGDNFLVYTSNPEEQAQMPNVAWGDNNDGANAIIAKDGFNDGTNKGLDVREMQYIHFDMWSAVATIYPQIALNDDVLGFFRLNGTGWQSFDLPLSTLTEDKLNNIRWIAFGGFRDPNPEEIAIDNVYFWSYGTQTTPIMGGDAATGGWATFASPAKVAVPSGLTAYKATYSNEGGDEQLVLDAVSGAIPANEGVLLRGEANHVYTFSPTNDAAGDYTGNALVGCPVRTDITSVAASNDIFCLRYSEIFQLTGFYLYSGQYIAAGKAYLPLAKAEPSSAPRRIRFVFREEQGTTGFDPTNAEAVPTTKFIENGQLYIRRGDAVYTIQGVRVK